MRLYNSIGEEALFKNPSFLQSEGNFSLYSTTLNPNIFSEAKKLWQQGTRKNTITGTLAVLSDLIAQQPLFLLVDEATGNIEEVRIEIVEDINRARFSYFPAQQKFTTNISAPEPGNSLSVMGECTNAGGSLTFDVVSSEKIHLQLNTTNTWSPNKTSLGLPDGTALEMMSVQDVCQTEISGSDVCRHWGRDYFYAGRYLGIVEENYGGRYRPDEYISRAEMVTLLIRAYGYNTAGRSIAGGDMDPTAWYNPYMATAVQEGILQGYGNGMYEPNKPVTRAEAVKLLAVARIRQFPSFIEKNFDRMALSRRFADVDGFAWFAPYISFATENNLASGYSDGTFRPFAPMTRAEAVKIIVNDMMGSEGFQNNLPY